MKEKSRELFSFTEYTFCPSNRIGRYGPQETLAWLPIGLYPMRDQGFPFGKGGRIMREAQRPFRQRYRINALRFLGSLAFCLVAVTASPPSIPIVTIVFENGGLVAMFVAIAGRAWSLLYIGDRKNSELVTCGPYSITRNPLYFFSLLGISGIGAQTGSLLSTALITAAAYLAFDAAMRGEEGYLSSRFGRRFSEYRESTPRLIPDFSLWQECEDIPLRSAKSLAGLKDGIVFVLGWLSVELIKIGQAHSLLPVFLTLPI